MPTILRPINGNASGAYVTPAGTSVAKTLATVAGEVVTVQNRLDGTAGDVDDALVDGTSLATRFAAVDAALPDIHHPPSWDDVVAPFVIGHRGASGGVAPENTQAAFDYAASLRVPIETDVQAAAGGELVLIHDATVDRTAGVSGNIAVDTLGADDLKRYDFGAFFVPALTDPQRIFTFEEWLTRYGRTNLLMPEVKDELDATALAMAEAIDRHGLTDSVVVQSGQLTNLTAIRAAYPSIRIAQVTGDLMEPATAVSRGLWGVIILSTLVTAEWVASLDAVGVKVIAYTINSASTADTSIAQGVHGLISDDPASLLEMAGSTRLPTGTTVIRVPQNIVGGGWVRKPNPNAGSYEVAPASGFAAFTAPGGAVPDGAFVRLTLRKARLADSPTTKTITTTLKVIDLPDSGSVTRWLAIQWGLLKDDDTTWTGTTGEQGYSFNYKLNGTVELNRFVDGVYTNIWGSAAWPALGAGSEVPLQIDITATTITVTKTDTLETSGAQTDATYPRGGFVSLVGSGVMPGIGDTTITY